MQRRSIIAGIAASALLAGCSAGGPKFRTYDGPEVTGIIVNKGQRRMYLVSDGRVLKRYKINLGFAPTGDKKVEGDGKTPEGLYTIDRRNPESRFHLSLGISYPNASDIAEARALGKSPGGEIFIHGQKNPFSKKRSTENWTWGCIAVTNPEIEEIYAMVKDGTPILINP